MEIFLGLGLALLTTLPLAWKWQLGVARVALVVTGFALLMCLLVVLVGSLVALGGIARAGLVWLLTMGTALAFLSWRFYRDPDRTPPDRDDVVVSPADGEVIYVRRSRNGLLPASSKNGRSYRLEELTKTQLDSEEAVVVGISLSFLDVHVNRAPIGGRVALQRRFPGGFGSLRRPETVFDNERATIVIEREGLQLAVVLIASRLVRRIVCYVREGDRLGLGQRLGMIRFGSQVDVVLPARPGLEVAVAPGERLTAGESIVAVL